MFADGAAPDSRNLLQGGGAVDDIIDPTMATGFGDLTMPNVEADPTSAGSNFRGVTVANIHGQQFILGTDGHRKENGMARALPGHLP